MNSLTHPHYHFTSLPCKGMKPIALKSYMLRIAFLSSCANPNLMLHIGPWHSGYIFLKPQWLFWGIMETLVLGTLCVMFKI